jgi:5,10-methylenetetrahydromethanopterin reductase
MVLSRCAQRTSRIGLGPGVLVPSLRHPMVNAAAIARAGGSSARSGRGGNRLRLYGSAGTGQAADAVAAGRRLRPLREGTSRRRNREVGGGEGAHAAAALGSIATATPRHGDVPILIGADGPKGLAVAAELGDGVFSAARHRVGARSPDWRRSASPSSCTGKQGHGGRRGNQKVDHQALTYSPGARTGSAPPMRPFRTSRWRRPAACPP